MKYEFTSLNEPKYQAFKDDVSKHHHNIIDFISVSDLRAQGMSDDTIADIASEYFDPEIWPIRKDPGNKVEGPFWARINEKEALAKASLVEVLAGGPNIGHREYTMSPDEAKRIWEEFLGFFDKNTRILYSVSLGSAGYVYSPGILIVDKDKAGVFNILAND